MKKDEIRVKFSRGQESIELEGNNLLILEQYIKNGGIERLFCDAFGVSRGDREYQSREKPTHSGSSNLNHTASQDFFSDTNGAYGKEKSSVSVPSDDSIPSQDEKGRFDSDSLDSGFPTEEENDSSASSSDETFNTQLLNDSIFAILKYRLNSREVFWLLAAIFYLSDFGSDEVSRDDILSLYKETNRATLSRKKNLSNNLRTMQSQYNWIEGSNSKYILTDDGISRAERLIAREEDSSLNNTYN